MPEQTQTPTDTSSAAAAAAAAASDVTPEAATAAAEPRTEPLVHLHRLLFAVVTETYPDAFVADQTEAYGVLEDAIDSVLHTYHDFIHHTVLLPYANLDKFITLREDFAHMQALLVSVRRPCSNFQRVVTATVALTSRNLITGQAVVQPHFGDPRIGYEFGRVDPVARTLLKLVLLVESYVYPKLPATHRKWLDFVKEIAKELWIRAPEFTNRADCERWLENGAGLLLDFTLSPSSHASLVQAARVASSQSYTTSHLTINSTPYRNRAIGNMVELVRDGILHGSVVREPGTALHFEAAPSDWRFGLYVDQFRRLDAGLLAWLFGDTADTFPRTNKLGALM